MNLNQLDLNLLIILKTLLDEKHVSNTALSLNISQSKVSRALQKLRVTFNDELLVKSKSGYELTVKARDIAETLGQVLQNLDRLMEGSHFDPATSKRTIRFFALAPSANVVLPTFISRLQVAAPDVVVDVDSKPQPHFEQLIAGDVHFVLSVGWPTALENTLYRSKVGELDFCFLMSKHHPLAEEEITAPLLRELKLGQISIDGTKTLSLDARLKQSGISVPDTLLSPPVLVSDFSLAFSIAEKSDVVFHVPKCFAEQAILGRDLILKPVPKEIEYPNREIYLYWHKRYHMDPMCIWVRDLIKSQVNHY